MRKLSSTRFLLAAGLMAGALSCTEPGQSTKMGAATGGAIGAGLGAIVGNQVGNTGTGLVIGAAGGAAAGGAVGNLFDAQDKRLAAQEESLTRREEALRAQKSEIDELRRIKGDNAFNSSSNYGGSSYGDQDVKYASSADIQAAKARIRPDLRSSAFTSPSYSYASASTSAENKAMRAGAIAERDVIETTPKIEQIKSPSDKIAAVIPPPRGETVKRAEPAPINASSGSLKEKTLVAEPPPAPAVEKEAAPAIEPASLNTDTSGNGDCSQATGESKKADAVSDTADKLFHMRRAIRLCPTEAKYHQQLSSLYGKMGRAEDAQFELKEAERLQGGHSKVEGEVVKSNRY